MQKKHLEKCGGKENIPHGPFGGKKNLDPVNTSSSNCNVKSIFLLLYVINTLQCIYRSLPLHYIYIISGCLVVRLHVYNTCNTRLLAVVRAATVLCRAESFETRQHHNQCTLHGITLHHPLCTTIHCTTSTFVP